MAGVADDPEQRRKALATANQRRTRIAILLRDLRTCERTEALDAAARHVDLIRVDTHTRDTYGSLTPGRLLGSLPGYGRYRAVRLASAARINPQRALRTFPPETLQRLAVVLRAESERLSRSTTSQRALARQYD